MHESSIANYLFIGLQSLDLLSTRVLEFSTSFNSNFHMGAKFFQLQYLSLDVTMSDIEEAAPENRPFYSCGLSTLAFEWMWGWRWPRKVTLKNTSYHRNKSIYITKQEGLYQNKVIVSLASISNCKMTSSLIVLSDNEIEIEIE